MKKSKLLKQLAAVLLVVTMLCAMTVSASAANTTVHSYNLYCIMTGTQAPGDSRLADIEWNEDGINVNMFVKALGNNGLISKTDRTAAEVAKALSAVISDTDDANLVAKLAYTWKGAPVNAEPIAAGSTIQGLEPGYYLAVDVTKFGDNETDTYYNLALLQLTEGGKIDINTKVEVPTVDKLVEENSTGEWQKAADYAVGERVPFKLTATVHKLDGFDTYKLVFHDHALNSDLAFIPESVVVRKNDDKVIAAKYYSVDVSNNNHDFTVTFNDILAYPINAVEGDTIDVYYEATLESTSNDVKKESINQVWLEYSNNPNVTDSLGKTPVEQAKVYSWNIAINKVDDSEEPKPLEGAVFQLYDAKHNKIGEPVEALKQANGNCVALFKGLDSGKYYIEEVTAPDGYNKAEEFVCDITVTDYGTYADGAFTPCVVAAAPVDIWTVDVSTFTVSATVVNEAGVVLPETGGIGTTVFYALGAAMMTLGVVLFITKKRVNEG